MEDAFRRQMLACLVICVLGVMCAIPGVAGLALPQLAGSSFAPTIAWCLIAAGAVFVASALSLFVLSRMSELSPE